MERLIGKTRLGLLQGDITKQTTEAIVNAANSRLLGGGGVDWAIHCAGGPQIVEECAQIRLRQGGCPPGEAVLTSGGNLKAKYVIHTVGPIWRGGNYGEATLLRNAYLNTLRLALDYKIRTISFPSISTGAYSYPMEKASVIAINTTRDFLLQNTGLTEVLFVLFSPEDFQIYAEALRECT